MAAHRRNARRVPVDSDPPTDTTNFMAAMNSMAIALRDSIVAIRESAAATNRAMEYMGRQNRNNGDDGNDDDIDNGTGGNNRPMTLATFLKDNPPSFSGATTVTKGEDCTKKLTVARASRRDQPSRNFDRNLAPQGRNFKNNGQSQRRFPEGKDRVQNGLECAKCGRYHGDRPCLF
ncbi:hypothetical protein PIB30_065658, partial [Stylosanthes scabra]|nr:hypothetical protein [Stylosanthes scabra]